MNVLIAYHVHNLAADIMCITIVAKKAGQSVKSYFSLPLTPPNGNKEIWLARETS